MDVDPGIAIAKKVPPLLASTKRVRAAGVICEVRDRWLAVHVNLTVLHDGLPDPQPLNLEAEGICAFDVLLRGQELEALAGHASEGSIRLPPSCRSAVIPGTSYGTGPRFLPRQFAARDWYVDWPCDEVTVQGGGFECEGLPDRFVRFAAALSGMEPPIDGIQALRQELGLVGELSVTRGGGHVYVRRPLAARLHMVRNTATVNELAIAVEAYPPLADSFQVSVMPQENRRAAFRVPASDFDRTENGVFIKRAAFPMPGPVRVALLTGAVEAADQCDAGLPSAPLLVHEQFDPDCGLLRNLLFGPSGRGQKESRDFEKGVAWLLHLCGCAAMHLGRRRSEEDLQGSPDIVAQTPGGDVLIGECSLRAPTAQKMGKLVERARSVEGLLTRAGVPGAVRALFFVAEACDRDSDDVEIVDVARLHDVVDRLRGGLPDGLAG